MIARPSILIPGALLALATVLYPPWIIQGGSGGVSSVGYGFILTGPEDPRWNAEAVIDVTRILVQLAAIGILTGVCHMACRLRSRT